MSINVINRRGEIIPLQLETISDRLKQLANISPRLNVSTDTIAVKTVASLVDGIKTSEIDTISANICASLIIEDHEYDTLAARIVISDLHKNTSSSLKCYANDLESYTYRNKNIKMMHPKVIAFINKYVHQLEKIVDYEKDYMNNFFGAMTLIKSYLLSYKYDSDLKIVKERPQQMLLRVAIGINLNKIEEDGSTDKSTFKSILDTYELLSDRYYTHATPTLFNAGTINHTLSSCYLLSIDDSLDNIYDRLGDISKISKFSGGVGVHMSQVRATGSVISSTIGRSEGLVPLMRVYNESTRYVSQGGGKRKGSTAVYLEPWHADVESALLSQKQQGAPERLCRDLFLALWVPDLFMERLKNALKTNKPVMWSLMCPNECPGLTDTYGVKFEELYKSYEAQGKFRKQISIKVLWDMIMATQIETGKPYLLYKDHVNRKSPQNNLGVIKSSNLCVHGDTKILTDKGYVRIEDVANTNVTIWDTTQFVEAPVRMTGRNQKLLKVTTDDGAQLKCTEYHRFSVLSTTSSDSSKHQLVVKKAQDLEVGDLLMNSTYPIIDGCEEFDSNYPYTHGFHCGDRSDYAINHLAALKLDDEATQTVPINSSLPNRLQWLAGFVDANGTVDDYIRIKSTNAILADVKLMCNTLGVNPILDNDHLIFSKMDTFVLFDRLRLKTRRVEFSGSKPLVDGSRNIRIRSIEDVEGLHTTYCFRSPITEMGIFNGIPTLNCAEITIYSDENNIGVCNLASICLPKFVKREGDNVFFDYKHLGQVMKTVVVNMNKVMDNNKYPLEAAKHSDDQNRPIGIGVQGLSEVFMMMKVPFDSPIAMDVNKKIFETMYYHAVVASNQLAQIDGPYKTFKTSMTATGTLQFDLWDVTPSDMWDWMSLKRDVVTHGLRNSLLMAIMPTAGTSIISGHTESVEVPQSNLFTRSTLSGRFQVVNKHLVDDLKAIGMWTKAIRNKIIENDGSVQSIQEIPQQIRDVYKTIYEYKLTSLIKMNRDREAYVCQSASNNRYLSSPDMSILTNMHLYAWKCGLKTSSYYVRVKQQSTGKKLIQNESEECISCSA